MFGSIGGPELLLIFVLALLLFGPRKLPEIGKTIGKTLAEFKRATSEFNVSLEREIEMEKLRELKSDLKDPFSAQESPPRSGPLLGPPAGTVVKDAGGGQAQVEAPVDLDGHRPG